jgi:hypothetical protein
MSKIDYYDSWPKWRMPAWLGVALGGVFAVVAVVCGLMIVKLTHRSAPAMASAPVVVEPKAAPVVAEPPAAAEPPAVAEPPVAPTPVVAASPTPAHAKSSKHARVHKASTKKAPAVLAKRDSKSKRSSKDSIDRLLGL